MAYTEKLSLAEKQKADTAHELLKKIFPNCNFKICGSTDDEYYRILVKDVSSKNKKLIKKLVGEYFVCRLLKANEAEAAEYQVVIKNVNIEKLTGYIFKHSKHVNTENVPVEIIHKHNDNVSVPPLQLSFISVAKWLKKFMQPYLATKEIIAGSSCFDMGNECLKIIIMPNNAENYYKEFITSIDKEAQFMSLNKLCGVYDRKGSYHLSNDITFKHIGNDSPHEHQSSNVILTNSVFMHVESDFVKKITQHGIRVAFSAYSSKRKRDYDPCPIRLIIDDQRVMQHILSLCEIPSLTQLSIFKIKTVLTLEKGLNESHKKIPMKELDKLPKELQTEFLGIVQHNSENMKLDSVSL